MSKTTLSESTQKRLLQLAHLSQYQDEVISEMKKVNSKLIQEAKMCEDDKASGHKGEDSYKKKKHEKSETSAEEKAEHKGGKGEKSEKHSEKEGKHVSGKEVKVKHVVSDKERRAGQAGSQHPYKGPGGKKKVTDAYQTARMVGEADEDMEDSELPEAPVGAEDESGEDEMGPEVPDFGEEDMGGEGTVEIDAEELAAGLADLLKNVTGITFNVSSEGAGMPEVEDEYETEDELDLEDSEVEAEDEMEDEDEGDLDLDLDMGPEDMDMGPEEPKTESKKVSKMVFDAVINRLAKKAGIDLKEAKKNGKVEVEFVKKKSLSEAFNDDPTEIFQDEPEEKAKASAYRKARGDRPGLTQALDQTEFDTGEAERRSAQFYKKGGTKVGGTEIGAFEKSPETKRQGAGLGPAKELGRLSSAQLQAIEDSKFITAKIPEDYRKVARQAVADAARQNADALLVAKIISTSYNQLKSKSNIDKKSVQDSILNWRPTFAEPEKMPTPSTLKIAAKGVGYLIDAIKGGFAPQEAEWFAPKKK